VYARSAISQSFEKGVDTLSDEMVQKAVEASTPDTPTVPEQIVETVRASTSAAPSLRDAVASMTKSPSLAGQEKVPSLADFIKQNAKEVHLDEVTSNVQEKWLVMKANMESMMSGDWSTAMRGNAANLGSGSMNLYDIMEALKFPEYGPWYAAALCLIIAVTQRQAGKDEARQEFEQQLKAVEEKAAAAAAKPSAQPSVRETVKSDVNTAASLLESTKARAVQVENVS
jgi:hypothetical protein